MKKDDRPPLERRPSCVQGHAGQTADREIVKVHRGEACGSRESQDRESESERQTQTQTPAVPKGMRGGREIQTETQIEREQQEADAQIQIIVDAVPKGMRER